jgi:hypothetical protein
MTDKPDTEKAPTPAPVLAPASSTAQVVEHQVLSIPAVTEIAFWLGGDLLRARIPNPCAIQPGETIPLSAVQDYLVSQ